MKIGIPRALFYYYYWPLWKTFFQELGAEVVTTPPTSKSIIERGVRLAVDEACLPIKTFYGHVDYLKKQVDLLFIPRLVSIASREYICPKFMGLPDMIKLNISNLPDIINTTVDCSKSTKQLRKAIFDTGKQLSSSSRAIQKAWNRAITNQLLFRKVVLSGQKHHAILENPNQELLSFQPSKIGKINIGLLGHGYSIYDSGISMQLFERLEKLGVNVLTTENLPTYLIELQAKQLPKQMFWTLGKKALGSTMHWINQGGVDGIIYLSAFGCGPDSLVGDLVERYCRNKNFPVLLLTVDEHTGEAGMATRIEAFVDLLERRIIS